MNYQQGHIVMIKQTLPHGQEKRHPFLIISCEAANQQEVQKFFTGVMLTHMAQTDMYTFEIKPEMVDGYLDKSFSQIRLYILAGFRESQIIEFKGTMKKFFLNEVLRRIHSYVLTIS